MDTKPAVDPGIDLASPTVYETAAAAQNPAVRECREGRRTKLSNLDPDAANSPDPRRHTDAYRLVMPFQQRI